MRTLAVLVCMVVACDAGEKPAPPHAPAKAAAKAARTDIAAPLSYLPADSDLVIKLDIAALRGTKLWTTYSRHVAKLLTPGFAGCSYDPLSTVSYVMVGVPLKSELAVFVVRGLDRDRTLQCLRALKVESEVTATFDGELVTLTNKSGAVNTVMFVDATTMVMQSSKQASKQTLTAVVQAGAPLARDQAFAPAFTAALEKQQPAPVMLLSRPGSTELAAKWKQLGFDVRELTGAMHVTDRLDTRVVMKLATPEQATQLAQTSQSQLKSIKQFFEGDAIAQGDTVTITIGMTDAQVQSLAAMVGGMTQP